MSFAAADNPFLLRSLFSFINIVCVRVFFFWISSDCIFFLHYHRLCEIHLILFSLFLRVFLVKNCFYPLIWTHFWRIVKPYWIAISLLMCNFSFLVLLLQLLHVTLAKQTLSSNLSNRYICSLLSHITTVWTLDSGEREWHKQASKQQQKNVTVTWKININWKSKVAFTN